VWSRVGVTPHAHIHRGRVHSCETRCRNCSGVALGSPLATGRAPRTGRGAQRVSTERPPRRTPHSAHHRNAERTRARAERHAAYHSHPKLIVCARTVPRVYVCVCVCVPCVCGSLCAHALRRQSVAIAAAHGGAPRPLGLTRHAAARSPCVLRHSGVRASPMHASVCVRLSPPSVAL